MCIRDSYNTPEMKKKITGRLLCKETYYISRFHDYSSSSIRAKIYESEKYKEDTKLYIEEEAIV